MRRLLTAVAALWLAAAAMAQSPVSISVSNLPAELARGSSARVGFELRLLDEAVVGTQGVWFLNIVEPLGGGDVRQVAHLLFASAREETTVFRRAFSTAELAGGLDTAIEFRLRPGAPVGSYLLALQLFDGPNTNPGRVKAADRMAMEFFPFRVVAAD